MSITVYWSCFDNEWLRAKEPKSVLKNFIGEKKSTNIELNRCPAFKDYLNNVYKLESIYDYEFEIKDGRVISSIYDQKFFDKHVLVRSIEDKSFSFSNNFIFFTEEDSLKMSLSAPILEDSDIAKNCMVVPGKFDIGKWFRTIDLAFYLRKDINIFKIKEGDALNYITFDSNKKIIFKQFMMNDKIKEYLIAVNNAKFSRKLKTRNINEYYLMFKNKKKIIKEIKNNLIE